MFSSISFEKDFMGFLQHDFLNSYKKVIEHKLTRFFSFFDVKTQNFDQIEKRVLNHLKYTKRIKFPWNISEINSAIEFFQRLILKIKKN